MKSMASSNKRGSISGTVIKEDLKRFWPVPVISLIVMLASGSLLLMILHYSHSEVEYFIRKCADCENIGFIAALIILGCGLGLTLFRYIEYDRSALMVHALPFSRKTLFISNYLTGLIMMAVPLFICGLTLLPWGLSFAAMLKWFCISMLSCVTMFSITVLAAMLSGNTPMHIFNTGLLNMLGLLVLATLELHCARFLYGFNGDTMERLINNSMPIMALFGSAEAKVVVFYLILTAVVTAAAYLAYKLRPVERTGDSLVFGWTRRFLLVIVTFGGMSLFGFFLNSVMGSSKDIGMTGTVALGMVIGFTVTFAVMSIIIYRTAKIFNRKNMITCAVTAVLCVAFVCAMAFDITGFASKVPELQDIKTASASIYEPQGTTDQRFEPALFRGVGVGTEVSYDGIASSDVSSTVFTEPANIESVYHIQKIIAMRKDIDMNTDFTATPFYYDFADSFTMTSGKKMVRKYTISKATYKDIEPYLKSLYESKEFKNDYKLTNLKGTITSIDYSYSGSGMHAVPTNEYAGLIRALDKDFAARTFEQEKKDTGNEFEIQIGKDDGLCVVSVKKTDKYTKAWLNSHRSLF
ncbi:MAG: hypothetical protein LKJ83_08920 [Eubacteriaceae bacterium]|jgi:hypothetical protein|nr:hypothetical protein [Eubacteriaceae bacterium]